MSVETMSGGLSVATAPGLGHAVGTPSGPSFSGEFGRGAFGPDVGGMHQPELNSNLFSQTVELNVSPPQTFDKNIGEVAFTHTEVLFDANKTINIEPVIESVPEVKTEKIPEALGEVTDNESLTNQVPINQPAISRLNTQEIEADVAQAEKVKEALIAMGTAVEDAEKSAAETLVKVEEEKGLLQNEKLATTETQNQTEALKDGLNVSGKFRDLVISNEVHFEHDAKADAKRHEVAQKAVAEVAIEFDAGKIKEVTGRTIAEKMPFEPQPEEVKSEILQSVKGQADGSYREAVKQLETTGVIYSRGEALQTVTKILDANHAVKTAKAVSSREATEQEVRKVLSG